MGKQFSEFAFWTTFTFFRTMALLHLTSGPKSHLSWCTLSCVTCSIPCQYQQEQHI